jgi:hypothetical protein
MVMGITQQMGREGFHWFVGIVKKIDGDPKKLGRVKIQIIGQHLNDVDPDILPWASFMMPTTSASLGGVGDTPSVSINTHVVGFWVDGYNKQQPVIFGTHLFNPDDDDGSSKHSLSLLARGENIIKKEKIGSVEPDSPYQAEYPHNRVITTKSGHVIELDDTEGAERIHIYHRKGAYIEIDKDGKLVVKTPTDSFDITGGIKTISVTGDCRLEVGGNLNATVNKGVQIAAEEDIVLATRGAIELMGKKGIRQSSAGSITATSKTGFSVTTGSFSTAGKATIGNAAKGTGRFISNGNTLVFEDGICVDIIKA